jgi:hypothetical protein
MLIFPKATIAVIKESLKDASTFNNGFPKNAGNFMRNLRKIVNLSGFWKPISTGTKGFRKLFYDCSSSILDALNQ